MARSRKKQALKVISSNAPPGDAGPPQSGDGEVTGRFVVIFKDDAMKSESESRRFLANTAGLSNVVVASDADDSAVSSDELASSDAVVFGNLGIAVISAEEAAVQSLALSASDADSPILVIEPEYRAYALNENAGLSPDYLRGFRDAVGHLYDQQRGSNGTAEMLEPLATFTDTPQLTWGLQATRTHTSPFGGKGIRLAVLDTGFDLRHPDFMGRPIVSRSFIAGEKVQDGNSHGTHCAGTACGPKTPATGVRRYGVAHSASLFVGKVLSNQGSGSTGGIVAGIEWALRKKCHIVSMSLGANINQKVQQYEVPIRRALARGTLIVAAAGNNANRAAGNFGFVGPPANADAAFAVGATDPAGGLPNFTARSSVVTGVGGKVNIAAPGVRVFSSVPQIHNVHGFMNGTSMATPHVAGIAALWAEATGETGARLWARLDQSAKPLAAPGVDVGAGLVQAPQ
jgi:subtilisin family serine protease